MIFDSTSFTVHIIITMVRPYCMDETNLKVESGVTGWIKFMC